MRSDVVRVEWKEVEWREWGWKSRSGDRGVEVGME
jgi:hypothetical protein